MGAALIALAFSGCMSNGSSDADAADEPASAVSFTGPWAAEFENYYQNASSDFERDVLADGIVSDQEYYEMAERFRACLASAGLSFSGFAADGSYTVNPSGQVDPDVVMEKTDSCGVEAGEPSIGALHSWIARNPNNESEASIMVACMIENRLVEATYTAEDWTRDNAEAPVPSFITQDQAETYEECVRDPLGVFGG